MGDAGAGRRRHIAGGAGVMWLSAVPAAVGSVRFRQTPGANPKVGASACRWRSDALVFRFSADDKESLWPQISFLPRRAGGSIWLRRRAGLLAGLAIIFWFPALASWWPSDLVRVYHAMPYVMRFGVASVADIPLVAYATLTLSGFVLAFCHPGHSKLPIVAWAVHNQPSPREMVDWILRSWVLQFGFLVIIFWRFAFMGKLSSDRLMQIVGIFNDVCYLATLVLAGILLRDGWRDFQGVAAPAGNIRIPLIFA